MDLCRVAFNLGLGFDIDHGALGIGAGLASHHADIRTLHVVQGDGVSHIGAQGRADLVQCELGGVLELDVAQAEGGIEQAREHRDDLLLLLRGHHVELEVLAQDVGHVGQGVLQVGLCA